jgi:regulator of replication initiation timing
MKKPTIKQQLEESNHKIVSIYDHMTSILGEDKTLQLYREQLVNDLNDVDDDIFSEQTFANENKTGAYKSAGNDARRRVKYLKKVRKEHLKLIKMFDTFVKLKNKIKGM